MMHKGFDLDLGSQSYSSFIKHGNEIHEEHKNEVKKTLNSFKDQNGKLIASEIIASWFPFVQANVFLSHAHKDADEVIGLSGWLHKEFGLTSFIDSCIWGYSEELLKIIDDEYCYQESNNTYNYQKRNKSTSHVYMMLSTALMQMINRCECIIFVNTPNSISPEEYIKDETTTDSPWIYSEIAMTSLVQKRTATAHRPIVTLEHAHAYDSVSRSLEINYDVDLSHLTKLSNNDLIKWRNKVTIKGAETLDELYLLKGGLHE